MRPLLHLRLSSRMPCWVMGADSPLFLDCSCHRLEEIAVSLCVHLAVATHVRWRGSVHLSSVLENAVLFVGLASQR